MANYDPLVTKFATKYRIPLPLARGMLSRESGGDTGAVSPAGAVGLLQIHLPSHPDVTPAQARNPRFNLNYGYRYLRSLKDRFGSWRLALAAYNAGPGAVESGEWEKYKETRDYVRSLLRLASSEADGAPATSQASVPAVREGAPSARMPDLSGIALSGLQRVASGEHYDPISALGETAMAYQQAQVQASAAVPDLPTEQRVRVVRGGRASTPARAAVKFAAAQLGKPYVWGGESPAEGGFDCSGLIDWAYRQAGVDFPGRLTTYTALKVGRSVRGKGYRPGDLVIVNGGKHMVIYAGGGRVIAAPHTGAKVRYQPLSDFRGSIVDVRRVG